jgi:hypothetical protein
MDKTVLSLYCVFGVIILIGYIYMIINKDKYNNSIWNKIKDNKMKKVYMVMISLSFILGIYLVYFFTTTDNKNKDLLYTGLVLLLLFSSIWAWFPFIQSKIVLFFVSMGSLLLLINVGIELSKDRSPKVIFALIACIILFIQTFVFDFILWNGIV